MKRHRARAMSVLWRNGYDVTVPSWVSQAACAHVGDPELFFTADFLRPTVTSNKGLVNHERVEEMAQRAKAVCAMCPVRRQCLQTALERSEPAGIWGGLTTPERRILAGGRWRR